MKREQRLFWQRMLAIVSFLIAIIGTVLWYRSNLTGTSKPSWLTAVVAYGWMFVALFVFDRIAKTQARKRRTEHFRRPPGK